MPLSLLPTSLLEHILSEAFTLLESPGIRLQCPEAAALLESAGARLEPLESAGPPSLAAHLPRRLVEQALGSAPSEFWLYDRAGNPAVHYGGNDVHFDPGSCAVNVLDIDTGAGLERSMPEARAGFKPAPTGPYRHRPSTSADLVRLVQVAEQLPQFAAQSTAVVCHDCPPGVPSDLYRLYLVLLNSAKPVVTGAFPSEDHLGTGSAETLPVMLRLLAVEAGGADSLRARPRAVFDVCPSPPLTWTHFAAKNLIDLGRAGVPAQIVSMPLAGAAAPVTLAGSVVQHTAECLAGVAIHQLAAPGAPIVWGGAPAIFDMRSGTTPMGAMETAMLCAAYSQVGKRLGLPTHAYLGASDSKLVDAQCGLESGMTALVGLLAEINMISGAGMLDFLACQSPEKLVLDAEGIAMAQRLAAGIGPAPYGVLREVGAAGEFPSLAVEQFARLGFSGDFLKLPETRRLFRQEQHLPSPVIDRGSLRAWQESGAADAFQRAHSRVEELVSRFKPPALDPSIARAMEEAVFLG